MSRTYDKNDSSGLSKLYKTAKEQILSNELVLHLPLTNSQSWLMAASMKYISHKIYIDRFAPRRVDMLEMKGLRTICGLRWFDQVSNE